MGVPVKRYVRKKDVNDPTSPDYHYLKLVGKSQRMQTIKKIASRIEVRDSLSAEDVEHAINSFVRELKNLLKEGHKVKVDNLGIFFLSINSTGTPVAEDCTVKNIRKVNIRFRPDRSLQLVNDALASDSESANNVQFFIVPEEESL